MKVIGVGAIYCTQLPVDNEVDHDVGGRGKRKTKKTKLSLIKTERYLFIVRES